MSDATDMERSGELEATPTRVDSIASQVSQSWTRKPMTQTHVPRVLNAPGIPLFRVTIEVCVRGALCALHPKDQLLRRLLEMQERYLMVLDHNEDRSREFRTA